MSRSVGEVLEEELSRPSAILLYLQRGLPPYVERTRWQKIKSWIHRHRPYFHVSWGYKDWGMDE